MVYRDQELTGRLRPQRAQERPVRLHVLRQRAARECARGEPWRLVRPGRQAPRLAVEGFEREAAGSL